MTKTIVTPGEIVTEERKRLGQHVYVRDGKIHSDCIGLAKVEANEASVVPLEGKYKAEPEDVILGVISEEKFSGYSVELNHYYKSFISKKDVREIMKEGTIISAKIVSVNELNEVELGNPRIFYGGEIIAISPVKVPRVIGKNCSMLDVLRKGTNCNIVVGKNGWIWAKGEKTKLLAMALEKIEREAHLDQLTDRITKFLEEENKKLGESNASSEIVSTEDKEKEGKNLSKKKVDK